MQLWFVIRVLIGIYRVRFNRAGLSRCWKLKLLCHSSQLSGRIGLHLAHEVPAMNGRGDFAHSERGGNLFCEHAGNDKTHHLALTFCQLRVAFSQLSDLGLLLSQLVVAFQGLLNRIDQILVAVPEPREDHLTRPRAA